MSLLVCHSVLSSSLFSSFKSSNQNILSFPILDTFSLEWWWYTDRVGPSDFFIRLLLTFSCIHLCYLVQTCFVSFSAHLLCSSDQTTHIALKGGTLAPVLFRSSVLVLSILVSQHTSSLTYIKRQSWSHFREKPETVPGGLTQLLLARSSCLTQVSFHTFFNAIVMKVQVVHKGELWF